MIVNKDLAKIGRRPGEARKALRSKHLHLFLFSSTLYGVAACN
jgi:hypothetical protein